MKITEYQEKAARTAKFFMNPQQNLNHAALGISSEAGELAVTIASAWMKMPFDVHNIPEELGDASWYAAYMCEFMGWQFEDLLLEPALASEISQPLAAAVLGRNPPAMVLMLGHFAGEVTSIIKAHVIYGKELDKHLLKTNLAMYVTTLSLLASIHEMDYEHIVLRNNIAKLQERYPDKYSDEAAITRADKNPVQLELPL